MSPCGFPSWATFFFQTAHRYNKLFLILFVLKDIMSHTNMDTKFPPVKQHIEMFQIGHLNSILYSQIRTYSKGSIHQKSVVIK